MKRFVVHRSCISTHIKRPRILMTRVSCYCLGTSPAGWTQRSLHQGILFAGLFWLLQSSRNSDFALDFRHVIRHVLTGRACVQESSCSRLTKSEVLKLQRQPQLQRQLVQFVALCSFVKEGTVLALRHFHTHHTLEPWTTEFAQRGN